MAKKYAEYDDLGVRFIYPKNWFARTETWDKGTYCITVDCPEGSFWSLSIMPKTADLDQAAKDIVRTMRAEYEEMEEREIRRYVADRVLTGYEIDFFYLDLTSAATALKFEDGRRGYVIYWQTCDRLTTEGESLSRADIFDAMTHSLVSNLTGQEPDWDDEDDDFVFDRKLSERQAREDEDREYFRRKYEQARLDEEEANWRRGGESLDDEFERVGTGGFGSDERTEDFLRDSDDEEVDEEFEREEFDAEDDDLDEDDDF
ncbi:MAG: hypothetical protein IJM30_12855 [Thermoguttaceae bacterium]|nr:hypothetical protein [Thermoguttaceae bacterium]